MHKPLTSWKNVLTSLGRRVNWPNFYRSKQQRTLARHQENSRLRLEVECLETRRMLTFIVAAFETPDLVVTTTVDIVDPLDGETSLREAIEFANDPTVGPDAEIEDFFLDEIIFSLSLIHI